MTQQKAAEYIASGSADTLDICCVAMSALLKKSPGTSRGCSHLNVDAGDKVVFLGEEVGTYRVWNPPRSNSAGDPVVISSDEEEEDSMAAHHSSRAPLHYPPASLHHHTHHDRHRQRHRRRAHSGGAPHNDHVVILSPHNSRGPMDSYVTREKIKSPNHHHKFDRLSPPRSYSRSRLSPGYLSPPRHSHNRPPSCHHPRNGLTPTRSPLPVPSSSYSTSKRLFVERTIPGKGKRPRNMSPDPNIKTTSPSKKLKYCNSRPQHTAARDPQHTAARGPQHTAARGPQHTAARGPQHTAARDPQHTAARGPQHTAAARGPQHTAAARDPQHTAARDPQHTAARDPQHTAARGPQHTAAARGPQHTAPRGHTSSVLNGYRGHAGIAGIAPSAGRSEWKTLNGIKKEVMSPHAVEQDSSLTLSGLTLRTSPVSPQSPSPSLSSPSSRKHSLRLSLAAREGQFSLFEPLTPSPPDVKCRGMEEGRRWRIGKRDAVKEDGDTTPEISPARSRLSTSVSLHSATPRNRQKRLESFLLDQDATPPLKKSVPTLGLTRKETKPPMTENTQSPLEERPRPEPRSPHVRTSGISSGTAAATSPHGIESISPTPLPEATYNFPTSQEEPADRAISIPAWSEDELEMRESECQSLPQVEPQIPGVYVGCASAESGMPMARCQWNFVEVHIPVVLGGDRRRDQKFVQSLEVLNSRGFYIPDSHLQTVLKCVLSISDPSLLLRLHSVLVADVSLRPISAPLSACTLWELMDNCCKKLLSAHSAVTPPTSNTYPLCSHVVLLYLVSVLAGDVVAHEADLPSSLVERTLSLTSKWQRVLVVVDLLLKLLPHNNSSSSFLPDLQPVLAALLCLPVSTSRECHREDGAARLARELSCRMARLISTQLKTDLVLLFPCHLLREKVISIHLETEFLLRSSSSSSQNPSPPSEYVSLDLIASTHLSRCPYHHNGSPHDLAFFLSLLYHLLHSHCSTLLGLSFLGPHLTSWVTPPGELAELMEAIAPQIRALPKRLSEDDALLIDLTSPRCWFFLQLLERMIH